jgi:acetyltransferase-like isoleucine patch superfamily enzyme
LRREHRPYYIRHARSALEKFYTKRFLRPHFDSFGEGANFCSPWHVHVAGPRIEIGKYVNVVASSDQQVAFAVWPESEGKGRITVGDYTIVNPGVRISSACEVTIGPNCMIASRALITDSDWHGIYDRVYQLADSSPVHLQENVWIGDLAIVGKGVTIGKNSIVGAGSVVVKDIPANTVAAGNPARPVKDIDPDGPFTTREQLFADPAALFRTLDAFERQLLSGNTTLGWLRYLLFPRPGD